MKAEKCPLEKLIFNTSLIEMVKYSEKLRGDWESFIENEAVNSTFLHSRSFFDHDPRNAESDSSFIFYKKRKVLAVFPAVIYNMGGSCILHSHQRSTYGGFVVGKKFGLADALNVVEQVITFSKHNGINQIIIRNPFRIYHSHPCDETDYAMWYYGFKIKSRELEIAVSLKLEDYTHELLYNGNTRRNVKKGLGNIDVRISDDYIHFWDLLERSLLESHGKTPVHDLTLVCRLREKLGDDKVLLFAGYFEDRLIGGAVIFNFGKTLQAQYIASDKGYDHLCPHHVIIDHIIRWGKKNGMQFLNLGMANECDGRKINFGLFRFKQNFGGRGILRETMYLDLN